MSDFRVKLDETNGVEYELDWDQKTGLWSLSEREIGLGTKWDEGLTPSDHQLTGLLRFFAIENTMTSPENLRTMSPEDLTNENHKLGKNDIFATLCDKCGGHYYVFKWEYNISKWAVYGRTCEYSWRRGDYVKTDLDLATLKVARKDDSVDPQLPPK